MCASTQAMCKEVASQNRRPHCKLLVRIGARSGRVPGTNPWRIVRPPRGRCWCPTRVSSPGTRPSEDVHQNPADLSARPSLSQGDKYKSGKVVLPDLGMAIEKLHHNGD